MYLFCSKLSPFGPSFCLVHAFKKCLLKEWARLPENSLGLHIRHIAVFLRLICHEERLHVLSSLSPPFSFQTVYDQYFITLYNIVYTSLPVLAMGVFDQVWGGSVMIKQDGEKDIAVQESH